ncbi:MAG: phophatidylserine decarboxylase associated domain-containing protein [Candidatus Eremiobacteraeota bacterium]|nr:phophatidylserine decarboxylase associated domain-containing protein [Candidatus Eremiobacteraeota bacterium]
MSEHTTIPRYLRGRGAALHLPRSKAALDEFHAKIKQKVDAVTAAGEGGQWDPTVQAMADLIAADPIIRMYAEEMIVQVQQLPNPPPSTVTSVEQMLEALNYIVTLAPEYNPDPSQRNAFPMSSLFAYLMMTVAGEALFRNRAYNASVQAILQQWCAYLNSPDSTSVLNDGYYGWISPPAITEFHLDDFIFDPNAPFGGWTSYNDFFHREIQPQNRPVAGPGDPTVVVSANDGNLVSIAQGVQRTAQFWLKDEPFSLADMLNDSSFVDRFVGGDVVQTFLSGANYHRWRAPISGTVVSTEVVGGLMFSDAEAAGLDPNAVLSEGYYASVNTRGLVYIDSGDPVLGTVCVIPIGITEISSVTITVQPGQVIAKGDELGYFSYGGSSMCLVFQPGAIASYTVGPPPPYPIVDPSSGPPVVANAQIAVANV